MEAESDPLEAIVVVCNYVNGRSYVAKGAKAFVRRAMWDDSLGDVVVVVKSRGGRWVNKVERVWELENFRTAIVTQNGPFWRNGELTKGYNLSPHWVPKAEVESQRKWAEQDVEYLKSLKAQFD